MAFLIENRRGEVTKVCTPELFKAVCTSPVIIQTISEIRQKMTNYYFHLQSGNELEAKKWKSEAGKQKATLPGFIFQARQMVDHEWIDSKKKSHGVGAWRHQDWALVNGLVMCDFDGIENPKQVFAEKLEKLTLSGVVLLAFITPSGHGLKVVFIANPEIGDIAANQQEFAKQIGLDLDEVCIDASRLSFVCTKDDILFIDKRLFEYENEAFKEKFTKQYFKGVTHGDLFGGNIRSVAANQGGDVNRDNSDIADRQNEPEGLPVADRQVLDYSDYTYCGISIPSIIEKLCEVYKPAEGKRHDSLFQISKMLRYVCERSEKKVAFFMRQLEWVKELDVEDGNVDKTISDAMNKPYSSYMPKTLKSALKDLGYEEKVEHNITEELIPYREWGERLKKLFGVFPCLAEISYNMEASMIPAALYVSAAFFGTLMTRTWYHFWFQPMIQRRLNYSIIIIGDPGSGKSFAGPLYDIICEPIIVTDRVGNDAINKYKKERTELNTKSDKNKKDGLRAPENIIRIHGPRTANGVFIEDMVRAQDIVDGKPMHLHLLTFSAELDSMTQANKGGQWIDKTNFELLAFHNEEDNQQYKNLDSVNGPFNVYWNFVYTGTPIALAKKVNERNFGTGLFGRLGCVPIASDYFTCAEERKRTKTEEARDATLREWAYKLDKVQGYLPLEPVVHETHKFVRDDMELAKIDGNKAEAFLVRRVPYYGINISAPFILMRHWQEWEEKRTFKCDKYDIELARIVMEIQLHSQRKFFGKYAEMYFDNSQREKVEKQMSGYKSRSNDIFNSLPEIFSKADILKNEGVTESGATQLIYRWCKSGFCKKIVGKKGNEKWTKKMS